MLPKWTTFSFVRTGNEQNKRCSPERLPAWRNPLKVAQIAGGRFELPAFGLWPRHAPICVIPRCCFYTDPSINGSYSSIFNKLCCNRRGWDSNPCAQKDKRISRPPRYDRFDTSPNVAHRITRNFPNKTAYPNGRVPEPFRRTSPKTSLSLRVGPRSGGKKTQILRIYAARANDRTRTDDLLITNQLLCQLSYAG